jgi:hypothetical protein
MASDRRLALNSKSRLIAEEQPLFVCGTSRSGTSMVAETLRQQLHLGIAGETHYFDDLRVRLAKQLDEQLAGDQQRLVEDYFLALSHRPYGHQGEPEAGTMSRAALRSMAQEFGGTPDAYFVAFCRVSAEDKNRGDWGEKTPRHALRLDDILTRFPKARAIYLLRDPRAVVASYRDWENRGGFDLEKDPEHARALEEEHQRTQASYHPAIISLLWKAALRSVQQAQAKFGDDRVLIVYYEQLVAHPDEGFSELLKWTGIEGEIDSALIPMGNSSYEAFKETGGVSQAPVERWKQKLEPNEVRLVEFVCGRALERAGYQPLAPAASTFGLLRDLASACPAILRALRANASRSGGLVRYVLRRAYLAIR